MTRSVSYKHLVRIFDPQDIKQVEGTTEIFRCTRSFHGQTYQVWYIDSNNIWESAAKSQKQLNEYSEKVMQNDYYSSSSYLQWNFYHVFLANSDQIKSHLPAKLAVENNRIFSRKYVFTPAEMESWFKSYSVSNNSSSAELSDDLTTKWRNILKQGNLSELDSLVKYDTVIAKYLKTSRSNVKSKQTSATGRPNKTMHVDPVENINSIRIKKFRDWPKLPAPLDLGLVNLITGANGVGKTTLLESIELLICGKLKRNPKAKLEGVQISAKINNANTNLSFQESSKIYKQRAAIWYNIIETTNRMASAFNRYNFYNADAAYALAAEEARTRDKSIQNAFEDIALGPSVNQLEARLNGFRERFEKIERSESRIINSLKATIRQDSERARKLSSFDKNPQEFLSNLTQEARKAKWKSYANPLTDRLISKLERDIAKGSGWLSNIAEDLDWMKDLSYAQITILLKHYGELSNFIEKQKGLLAQIEQTLIDENQFLQKSEAILGLLKKLKPYLNSPHFSELAKLNANIADRARTADNISGFRNRIQDLNLEVLANFAGTLTIHELKQQIDEEYSTLRTTAAKLAAEKSTIEREISEINQLLVNLRAQGRQLMAKYPTLTTCPICDTEHIGDSLKKKIQTPNSQINFPSTLNAVVEQFSAATAELNSGNIRRINCDIMFDAAKLLFGQNARNVKLNQIRKAVANADALYDRANSEHQSLLTIKAHFARFQLTDREFQALSNELSAFQLRIRNKSHFDTLLSDHAAKNLEARKRIKDAELSASKAQSEIDKLLIREQLSEDDGHKIIDDRIRLLQDAQSNLNEVSKIFGIHRKEGISTIEKRLSILSKLVDKYHDIKRKKDEYDLEFEKTNSQLIRCRKELKQHLEISNSVKTALSTLREILIENSKTSYLETFVDNNRQQIAKIFRLIHSPHEFADLKFTKSGGFELTRMNGKGKATLAEISTGQRSALALSVFLTLNLQLSNGPKLLIFDDPVAYIDDINTLAFFDYLRELAVTNSRQIFFATANSDLGFLFKKKFDFLGSEAFKIIPLARKAE